MSFISNEKITINGWQFNKRKSRKTGKRLTSFEAHYKDHTLQPGEVFSEKDPMFEPMSQDEYYNRAKELAESECIGLYEYISNPSQCKENNAIIGWVIEKDNIINNIKIRLSNSGNSELVLFTNEGYLVSYMLLRNSRTRYNDSSDNIRENVRSSGIWLKEFEREYTSINNQIKEWYKNIANKLNNILNINNSLIATYFTKQESKYFTEESNFRNDIVKETDKICNFFFKTKLEPEINKIISTSTNAINVVELESNISKECTELSNELPNLDFYTLTRKMCDLLQNEVSNVNNRVSGINESLILEKIEKHNILNPILWNSKNELKPEIKETLEEIVEQFVDDLKENDIEIKVLDSIIVGSNASYNYTEDSDLDLHIIVDTSIIDCKYGLLKIVYDYAKSMFNSKYELSIYDIPVEIYVEDLTTSVNSNGIYSLKDGWLKEPTQVDIPNVNIDDIYPEWEERANKLIDGDNTTFEEVDKYIDDIYLLRKQSIMKDGEYAKGNLVFKEIRNNGLLDELKELKNELKSKELSLE